jgi:oxygen-independent coproporphyrinogen-3 oxidase
MTTPYSLYLHIPFCRHRCAYCDFNTYAGQEDSIPAYVDALCQEIAFTGRNTSEKLALHTVFFGGGTPSLLSPRQFETILQTITESFDLLNPEVTIEANPGTVSLSALKDLRSLGINRISFGVQSANPFELRMLERAHSYFDVINAVTWARKAGFDNLNLDLIYGLPLQTLEVWSATLKLILGLAPEHLSLYALTLEHGTPFGRWSPAIRNLKLGRRP